MPRCLCYILSFYEILTVWHLRPLCDTSRACDVCRTRKLRCDATSKSDVTKCSRCTAYGLGEFERPSDSTTAIHSQIDHLNVFSDRLHLLAGRTDKTERTERVRVLFISANWLKCTFVKLAGMLKPWRKG